MTDPQLENQVEHPRTHTRHIVDQEETQRKKTGTVTLCGLTLSVSPGVLFYGGEQCGNCWRIKDVR